jgi:uncharacterized protein
MDSIVHFEIPADDPKRASEFYSKAFGWMMNPMPEMNYTMAGTTASNEMGMPTSPGAINGGVPARKDFKNLTGSEHTVVTIRVDDIDSSLQKIEKLGGKTVAGKMPIGEMGFTAYFKDTEGNVVGLYQASQQM